VVIVALVAVIVRRGTRSLWPALLVIEGLSVIAVLAASVVLLTTTGSSPAVGHEAPTTSGPSAWPLLVGIVVGVVISASGFVGFESGTSLGPEARRPFLIVPRVVRWAPVATGAVLAISTAAQAFAFARTGVDPASTASALPDLLAAEGSSSLWPIVLDLAIGASFFAGAVASATALARLLFALALDRVVPAPLARVHARHRTPHIALFCALPVIGGVPIIALALGASVRGIVDALVAIGVLGYLLAYLGVSLAAPAFLQRIGESTRPVRAASVAAATILSALVATYVVYQVMTGSMLPVVVVSAAIALSSVYFAVTIRRRPEIVHSLGVFDATSAEDLGPGRFDNRSPAA
jgi:amino acid transporter